MPRLLPLVVYPALAVALTWPLLPRLSSVLGALEGPGDPYLELWVLGWNLHTITTNPSALFSGRIFDANIFFPAPDTLAYSDHLILQALALLPVYWLTGDPVTCYNVLLLVSLAASGLAMHAYAREVGGSTAGAYVAGIAWAFWPYRIARLLHLNLQALYFLPLALLFLHRTVARRRWRDAVLLGVTAGLQAVSSLNYGLITAVALVTATVVLAIGTGQWRSARLAGRLIAAALIGAVLLAPFAWPYWIAQRREGFARNLYQASQHAARPASYVQVPEVNLLYGRTHLLTPRDAAGQPRTWRAESVEHVLFPGFAVTVLAALGAWTARRRANWPVVWSMAALATIGFVLSLGPDGVRPIYAAAHRFVFGFQAIRAPARFGILVALALAALASLAVTWLARERHSGGRRGVSQTLPPLLCVVMVLEYASVPLPFVPRPPRATAVGQWLAQAPGPGAVIHLPLTLDRRNTPPMVQSMEHWRPVVNGHSGQRPPFFTPLVDVMSTFPSAESLWTLRDFNVRFVVAPSPLPDRLDDRDGFTGLTLAETPLIERARFPEGVIYELAWTDAHEARIPRPAPPPPPPPGPIPFTPKEEATYEVRWLSGPLDVAAGTATLQVRPGGSGAAYELVASARTAPWVAQFFEAQQEFTTSASADLLPLVHLRDQREGQRHVVRQYRFDHDARVVRIGMPGEAESVTLTIPPGSRDALTAFYYTRTRVPAPGEVLRIPVNDGGRNLTLEITNAGPERVTIGGRQVDAVRLEPKLVARVERRAPVRMIVWIAADGTSVPLAAEVEAGFGRVRLDLVEYTR